MTKLELINKINEVRDRKEINLSYNQVLYLTDLINKIFNESCNDLADLREFFYQVDTRVEDDFGCAWTKSKYTRWGNTFFDLELHLILPYISNKAI